MNQSINLLACEVATQVCSVALSVNDKLFYRSDKTPKRSSEVLLSLIHELLLEANISVKKLNAIAVGHGPGSFMGVRLGIGVAQGLAFPHRIPLIGVSTLQIIAQSAFDLFQSTSVLTAWDARMQEMYYGSYRLNAAGVMQPVKSDQIIAPCQYQLPKADHYQLVGNAWSIYYDKFSPVFKSQFSFDKVERGWIYPSAKSLLRIAEERYRTKQYSMGNLLPVYLRNKVV
jgi:tRNA threonylcarbamoyladenosine biosynthesis protein TsaB